MDNTSSSVCASFAEVRQRPNGRPKYSSCRQAIRYEHPSNRLHQAHVYRNHNVNQREGREYHDKCSTLTTGFNLTCRELIKRDDVRRAAKNTGYIVSRLDSTYSNGDSESRCG
jgi:hypothetical protein